MRFAPLVSILLILILSRITSKLLNTSSRRTTCILKLVLIFNLWVLDIRGNYILLYYMLWQTIVWICKVRVIDSSCISVSIPFSVRISLNVENRNRELWIVYSLIAWFSWAVYHIGMLSTTHRIIAEFWMWSENVLILTLNFCLVIL